MILRTCQRDVVAFLFYEIEIGNSLCKQLCNLWGKFVNRYVGYSLREVAAPPKLFSLSFITAGRHTTHTTGKSCSFIAASHQGQGGNKWLWLFIKGRGTSEQADTQLINWRLLSTRTKANKLSPSSINAKFPPLLRCMLFGNFWKCFGRSSKIDRAASAVPSSQNSTHTRARPHWLLSL